MLLLGPVLKLAMRVLNKQSMSAFSKGLSFKETEKLEKPLRFLKVYTHHRADMKRKYRVVSITKTTAEQTFFPIGKERL
jgi:hypothetical protein